MGVGLPGIGVLSDQERFHAIREGERGDVSGAGGEFSGPEFEPQSVFNNQVCAACSLDVAWGGLIAMNFRSRFDNGSDGQTIPCNVPGQIRKNREGGQHLWLLLTGLIPVGYLVAPAAEQSQNSEGHSDGAMQQGMEGLLAVNSFICSVNFLVSVGISH